MNVRQIQDTLIEAERTVLTLHETRVGPAPLRAQQLPYVHTRADMNGWGKKPGEKDSLQKEDGDAHALYRREFWDQFPDLPTVDDAAKAHVLSETWIQMVDDDGERRALRAWAYAMAGGRPFARWCRSIEKISVMTGRRRKNRAVEKISAQLSSKASSHDETGDEGVLPVAPEIEHVSATIMDNASGHETGVNSWAADDAFQPILIHREEYQSGLKRQSIIVDDAEFSWAKRRNEVRRQREARRKRQAENEAAAKLAAEADGRREQEARRKRAA